MVKGWKNDPKWVAYYAAKKDAQLQRRVARAMQEQQIAMMMRDVDRSLRECERAFTAKPGFVSA